MAEIKSISKIIEEISPYYKEKGGPEAEHNLVYESYSESLEPIYYFIIDLMNDFGLKPEKLVDNFVSATGGAYFSETGMKAVRMQEEASKIMANINAVVRSVLNIVHDLKDYTIRLQSYDDMNSKDKSKTEGARLSLKQIWMDKVDISKGNSSIKAMALGQVGFQTLIHAFLAAKDEKDVEKMDLNDIVKRILKPRIHEFNIWVEESEKELRKRYEIERVYLKSQVNSVKLYSRWAKPYLKAAQELEMKEPGRSPDLVKTFNRVLLELTLLGKSKLNVKDLALAGELPREFAKEGFLKSLKRNYYSCILVDFNFRAVPQQGAFIGKADVSFKVYALNDDEINKLDKELDNSDLGDALKLIEGTTTESLKQLQDEINFFLEEKTKEEKEKTNEGANPFLAIIGYYGKKPERKKEKEEKEIIVKKDNFIEKEHLRKLSAEKAKDTAFNIFDIYKKAHGMASFT